MRFEELLHLLGKNPLFESSLLLSGDVDAHSLQVQLARWTQAGKLQRLRRGLYLLAEPYRSYTPHPFVIANRLHPPAYVSLQSALAYYGLIPEEAFTVTSVTTRRPTVYTTPLGAFSFRHLQPGRFFGYHLVEVVPGQSAWLAWPEKALLDLIYLTPGSDVPAFLQELRLQHLQRLDPERLQDFAARMASPKVHRAVPWILAQRQEEEAP